MALLVPPPESLQLAAQAVHELPARMGCNQLGKHSQEDRGGAEDANRSH
eukprot:CAMPEP_0170641766 /NCGR_PEP_ID=MMETSP0224-20130122/40958_1 /TAXON_ID=285029 /ORGANISM="Togula jolla, Strain CCCM 725" /LENGTH=48 /DNA_ID= /DNA_START= /DNA_END= /DNA_ORIENTATION=